MRDLCYPVLRCGLWCLQGSFANVKCVNGGAVELPAHGRQINREDAEYKTEQVGQAGLIALHTHQERACPTM